MSLAQEIRELQKRLEQISEAPGDVQAAVAASGQPDDATGVDAAVAKQASAPAAPAPASDGIPTIEAPTFKQAYAQAAKQGLKKFRWCGVYAVKAPVPVQPRPTPAPPQKVDYLGQETPLGGTLQNPMSFAPNSGFGA